MGEEQQSVSEMETWPEIVGKKWMYICCAVM